MAEGAADRAHDSAESSQLLEASPSGQGAGQELDETTRSDISERPSVEDVESETGSTGALETRSLKDHKGKDEPLNSSCCEPVVLEDRVMSESSALAQGLWPAFGVVKRASAGAWKSLSLCCASHRSGSNLLYLQVSRLPWPF